MKYTVTFKNAANEVLVTRNIEADGWEQALRDIASGAIASPIPESTADIDVRELVPGGGTT